MGPGLATSTELCWASGFSSIFLVLGRGLQHFSLKTVKPNRGKIDRFLGLTFLKPGFAVQKLGSGLLELGFAALPKNL